jgi:arginyl-tRNA synthetase
MTNLLRAASFILCGDNIEEQLNSLDNAIMNDLCNVEIPSDVVVWEKFEDESAETIMQIIEDLEIQFDEANKDFIKSLLINKTK